MPRRYTPRNDDLISASLMVFKALSMCLIKQDITHLQACMEATGSYGDALATDLYEHGCKVSVVNPAQIKSFSGAQLRRAKTDKADAKLIAQFCASLHPVAWMPPPVHVRELQAVNQAALLDSILGIGVATSARLLAVVGDVHRFNDAKALVAFVGLNPTMHQSGSSVRGKPRLSKKGNATIRKALYMPAIVARRYNPIIKDFATRLKKAGKSNMLIMLLRMLDRQDGILINYVHYIHITSLINRLNYPTHLTIVCICLLSFEPYTLTTK